MPDFATAYGVKSLDKKLSKNELIRALRFSVAAEYEAVQIYEQIVEAIDDDGTKVIIQDIISEEKLHAGQFLSLLFDLAPDEREPYVKGEAENKELKQGISKE
ncbi:MAG: rubrerythrin [Candidatus Bathyarchaeota archaeon]|nr:rubrerythrin [Candidatus Bathyarchaeota archaeon]